MVAREQDRYIVHRSFSHRSWCGAAVSCVAVVLSGGATLSDVIVQASRVLGWSTTAAAGDLVSVPSGGWGV